MADIVFNIAKGRVAEFITRVDGNDPAPSAIIVVPVDVAAVSDATIRDFTTLAAILAGGVTERTATGWTRKTLTDAEIAAITTDQANDRNDASLPAIIWSTVTAGAVTDLVVCYDADTGAGTDTNIIPLTMHDFPITPDGSNVQADAGVFFRAS